MNSLHARVVESGRHIIDSICMCPCSGCLIAAGCICPECDATKCEAHTIDPRPEVPAGGHQGASTPTQ